ncbi:hemolysin D [Bacteroidia bacterium]|nr:hemolysin D [Bacteroidia bacterium]
MFIFACSGNRSNSNVDTTTPVWIEDATRRVIEECITATGTAKATKTVELKSEIVGQYVLQTNPKTGRPYQLGDIVEQGAVVVKISNREYENGIQLESKKLQVQITEKEWEGHKSLLVKGGSTQKDINNAESAYINAKLALETAYISLGKMRVNAPYKGVLVNLPYYTPNVELASGSVIAGVMDYSKMYLETQFPENAIDKLTVGQNVYITNYNIKSDTLKGKLTQLSPAINESTRTFTGFITIENPELKLRPGMFAKADIVTTHKENILAVKKDAVVNRRGSKMLYTIERSTASEKVVKTGISDAQYIEIISGITESDKIVTKGYEWLREGSRVKVMR